jgi:hypothetical protein
MNDAAIVRAGAAGAEELLVVIASMAEVFGASPDSSKSEGSRACERRPRDRLGVSGRGEAVIDVSAASSGVDV